MLKIGTGKAPLSTNKTGIGMMGYGRYFHVVEGKDTPLYSRALFIEEKESGKRTCIVVAEICFVSISIKKGVMKKLNRFYHELGLTNENLLLTAQHTHSGPGGYSHYGFYNLSIPGFVPEVYQSIVEAIVESIVLASRTLTEGRIHYSEGEFSPDIDIAFNRSYHAYNENPEVKKKISKRETHLAVNREMNMLRFEDSSGIPLAALNFFGVHTTSMPNTSTNINWDNKGYAADFMEKEEIEKSGNPGFIALFAQGTAGDITPNYVYDILLGRTRGPFKEGIKNAVHAGKHQFKLASTLFSSQKQDGLSPLLDSFITYSDFSKVVVDPDFAFGQEGHSTSLPCIGIDMIAGTKEGPGMPSIGAFFARYLIKGLKVVDKLKSNFASEEERKEILHKYESQGNKAIVIETGARKVLITRNVKNVILPGFLDGGIAALKRFHKQGGLDKNPWTPLILPLQIIRLGSVILATIPGEITTIAGRRLRQTILDELSSEGVKKVILVPYSNAYSGYITTYEEYQLQYYEGGHTVFGQWTLAAFQTEYRKMCKSIKAKLHSTEKQPHLKPVEFTKEELKLRGFQEEYSKLFKKKRKQSV